MHVRITLLSDIYTTAGYQGRATITLLQHIVSGDSKEILLNLGSLHRQYLWDNIRLQDDPVFNRTVIPNPDNWDSLLPSSMPPPLRLPGPSPEPTGAGSSTNGLTDGAVGETPSVPSASSKEKSSSKEEGPIEQNARALKHMTTQVPNTLTSLFQCQYSSSILYLSLIIPL